MKPLIEQLDVEKNKRGLITIRPTLQLAAVRQRLRARRHRLLPARGSDTSRHCPTRVSGSASGGHNVKAFLYGNELDTKHFEELGEAISLGTERAAVLYWRKSVRWRARTAGTFRVVHVASADVASSLTRWRQLVFRRNCAAAAFAARSGTLIVYITGDEPVASLFEFLICVIWIVLIGRVARYNAIRAVAGTASPDWQICPHLLKR